MSNPATCNRLASTTFAMLLSCSTSYPSLSVTSPELWYMGSLMGPLRSKTQVAGKSFSQKLWWSEQHAGV